MDRKEIREFVREVMGPNTPMSDIGEWVSIPCALAKHTHSSGRDANPSAGISVKPGGVSIFHCLACHRKGTLPWLLRQLEKFTGEDYESYADSIERGDFLSGNVPAWGERETTKHDPLDKETYFDLYESAETHPYLALRGVTPEAARRMELLHDPGGRGGERIVFPVYDLAGNLYGFSGRAVDPNVKPRIKDYHGLPKKSLLLGAHLVRREDKAVLLVEGLFDYARLVTHGLPALAFMSSTLTKEQAEIVLGIGKPVYFFHDNDGPGEEARDKARGLLWKHIPLMKVRYPREPTVETPEGDLRPPKDPAELTQAQVLWMMENARLL